MRDGAYLVSLNLEGAKILVVGGGAVAARKIMRLPKSIREVVVVAPDISGRVVSYVTTSGVKYQLNFREYSDEDLDGTDVVFAATSSRDLNQRIASRAKELRILVNDVSNILNGSFSNVALVERGGISIGVTSNPVVPGFSVEICRLIDEKLPSEIGELLVLVAKIRAKAHSTGLLFKDVDWMKAFDPSIFELISAGDLLHAEESLARCLL